VVSLLILNSATYKALSVKRTAGRQANRRIPISGAGSLARKQKEWYRNEENNFYNSGFINCLFFN
jgi:hypothetical protein